jgi:K+-transporting ATPase ATPase C chain
MFVNVLKQIKIGLLLLILFTFFTGFIYPLIVTGIAQLFFPVKANGSLIEQHGKIIGSLLIGQYFDSPTYFWGRPSATTPYPYNSASSTGSNLGPSNYDFLKTVSDRVNTLQRYHFKDKNPVLTRGELSITHHVIPIDLVTASASGLDPEISPYAALYQINRIATVSHIPSKEIENIVNTLIKYRTLGIFGEPRINVLELNIALDRLRSVSAKETS